MSVGFYYNGEIHSINKSIDKLVTIHGISVVGIDMESTLLLHPLAVNAAIPKNLTMDQLTLMYEESFDEFKIISQWGKEVLSGHSIEGDPTGFKVNNLNIIDKNIVRERFNDRYEGDEVFNHEYDCEKAFMHILPFKFSIDNEPKDIYDPAQLKCITMGAMSVGYTNYDAGDNNKLKSISYLKNTGLYLNAKPGPKYRRFAQLRRSLEDITMQMNDRYREYYDDPNLDCSKLIYGLFLSGIYLHLPRNEAFRLKESIDCIGKVVAESVLANSEVREAYTTIDSVVTPEKWSDSYRHPLYRSKLKLKSHKDHIIIDHYITTLMANNILEYTPSAENNLGWYSTEFTDIVNNNPGWSTYHIDIHAAYVKLIKDYSGINITKQDAGKVISIDPYLYEMVRKEISNRSNDLLSYYGADQKLIFWQIDGGVCLIKDTVNIEEIRLDNYDIVVERIVGKDTHRLGSHVNLSGLNYKRITRVPIFAYTIYFGDKGEEVDSYDIYANNFSDYRKTIFENNKVLGLTNLSKRALIEVLKGDTNEHTR